MTIRLLIPNHKNKFSTNRGLEPNAGMTVTFFTLANYCQQVKKTGNKKSPLITLIFTN
jgi:hypothetical protein